MSARFIWTADAIDRLDRGEPDPFHTISAPNIHNVYDGFVDQLQPGTPWILVDATGQIIDSGVAGQVVRV